MFLKIVYLLLLLAPYALYAQSNDKSENRMNEEDLNIQTHSEWVPGLLNASPNALFNLVMYNGRIFSWNLREENQSATIVDGIDWQSNIHGWNGNFLFMGMNYIFKRNELILNGAHSSNGYWTYPNINLLSTQNNQEKKSTTVLSSFSNTSNINNVKSLALVYHTGRLRWKNVLMSTAIKFENAPLGVLPNGYKNAANLFFSIDKKWDNKVSVGLSVLWNYSNQGRAATTTNELFALTNQRTYSPNWGWYHQQMYFPSTRQTNAPVISIRYERKWSEKTSIAINNGIVLGKESKSNLEWTNAADPRPDYYKYLPSYIADTLLRAQLSNWYETHPENLQINFDRLARVNKASMSKRSFYIVNQENSQLCMLHGSILFSRVFQQQLNVQLGIQYAWDQIHFYNTIKDLLGGDFFYNYNGWMNDDALVLSFQNDVNAPNKKIKQGERWGADYTIRSFQAKPWFQIQKKGPVFESAFALGYGVEGLERNGFNQNGLFVNSKGSSGFNYFSTADMKAQLLYKVNGRLYFRSIFFAQWLAPKYQSVFMDPDMHPLSAPYALQESKFGADLSVFYRAPNFKSSLSLYQKLNYNETDNRMFYHDAYALFVYGAIGNINSSFNGMEWVAETNLVQHIKLNYATTFVNSYFLDNPNYQYLDVNNLQVKESGLLQIKNLPKSNSPKFVNAISMLYQPAYGFTLGLTTVYAQERPVSMNLFRRSEWVKSKVDPITWSQIQQMNVLQDQFVVNAFASTYFQIKSTRQGVKIYKWSMSLSARNILNTLTPVIAYEQTRFDFLRFNKNKFPLKYLMDAGASYTFRIQLQIQ